MNNRKRKKIVAKAVQKMVNSIKEYSLPFKHSFSYGYFIFNFGNDNYNLHITFDHIPLIKFGIWKKDKLFDFFAEHIYFIDKFKPSAVAKNFDSLDDMMQFVLDCKDKNLYLQEMADWYNCKTVEDWLELESEEKIHSDNYRLRRGLSGLEYHNLISKFNSIINNIDNEFFDVFWIKSDGFMNTFDVWIYPYTHNGVEANEVLSKYEDLCSQFNNCRCFVWGDKPLPKYTSKYIRRRFSYIINPSRRHRYRI